MGLSTKKAEVERASGKGIIETLTRIRATNYHIVLVNRITESQYPAIKQLAIKLGNKILEENSHEPSGLVDAQAKFARVIDALFEANNKFAIVSFSAQLLQYYTVISDNDFVAGANLKDFNDFLESRLDAFGSVENNLLITEYQLIKIYNDLSALTDSVTEKIAPIIDMENQIDLLLSNLNVFKLKIDQWILDAPNNIFVHYLNFSMNYSCAKALELQCHIQDKTLSTDERLFLSSSQQYYLDAAKQSLQTINALNEQADNPCLSGSEFSLGQNVLVKIPISDPDSLMRQMSVM